MCYLSKYLKCIVKDTNGKELKNIKTLQEVYRYTNTGVYSVLRERSEKIKFLI